MGLDLVEFLIGIEEDFDLDIPDIDAARLLTLGDVHDYLVSHFGRNTNDPELVWQRLLVLAEEQFFVPAASLNRQTRILDLAPDG